MADRGRSIALSNLAGAAQERIPAGFLTWGFEYYFSAAGIEPWRLAGGSNGEWRRAHEALFDRHRPDILFYSGAGSGERSAELVEENEEHWLVRDANTDTEKRIIKRSLTVIDAGTERKPNDPIGKITNRDDARRLVPEFDGWGEAYLEGLASLIDYCGDDALVLPHHSPGYICACYAAGFAESMAMMIDDPDTFRYIADRYSAGDLLRMRELANAGAQAIFIADGWASADIISPAMFREFALPYQRSMVEAALTCGLRVILWNEGDVIPMLRDEMSLPWDAFGMEQSRKGVVLDIAELRAAAGPGRCIMGNIDSEELLRNGTRRQIEQAVIAQLERSGAGAPFILTTGSPLPSDTPPEAVDWMLEAVRRNGRL